VEAILADDRFTARARELSQNFGPDDGASLAADSIEKVLARHGNRNNAPPGACPAPTPARAGTDKSPEPAVHATFADGPAYQRRCHTKA
jgi:hypothetical protein